MSQKESSALAVVHSSTEIAALDQLDEILLTGELNVEVVDDPAEISKQIVAQLLAAESDEDLENFGNATGWKELIGIPMELHGFRWLPSTYDEGAAVFFVVQATRLDVGERVTLTTGSMNVLAQLSNMARRQTLVGAVRELVEADNPTRAGFKPLWLRTPETIKQAQREAAKQQPVSAPEPAKAKA